MHKNSLSAYAQLPLSTREREVVSIFTNAAQPITDRQCMTLGGYSEVNNVRPRITHLLEMGILHEVGDTQCEETGKTVRLCAVKP